MFDHFTFGPQAQTHFHQQDDISASPMDCTSSSMHQAPSSRHFQESFSCSSMNDILYKLTNQTLLPDENESTQSSSWTDTFLSPPVFEDAYSTDFALSYRSACHGLTTIRATSYLEESSPSRLDVGCRRRQRQLNTQLQSCTSHVKDISSLVEDMISTTSQCVIRPSSSSSVSALAPLIAPEPPPTTLPIEPSNDEGFSELDSAGALEHLMQEQQQRRRQEQDDTLTPRSENTPTNGIGQQLNGVRYLHCVGLKSYYYADGDVDVDGDSGGASGTAITLDGIGNYVPAPRDPGRGKIQNVPRMRTRRDYKHEKGRVGRRKRSGTDATATTITSCTSGMSLS